MTYRLIQLRNRISVLISLEEILTVEVLVEQTIDDDDHVGNGATLEAEYGQINKCNELC